MKRKMKRKGEKEMRKKRKKKSGLVILLRFSLGIILGVLST